MGLSIAADGDEDGVFSLASILMRNVTTHSAGTEIEIDRRPKHGEARELRSIAVAVDAANMEILRVSSVLRHTYALGLCLVHSTSSKSSIVDEGGKGLHDDSLKFKLKLKLELFGVRQNKNRQRFGVACSTRSGGQSQTPRGPMTRLLGIGRRRRVCRCISSSVVDFP